MTFCLRFIFKNFNGREQQQKPHQLLIQCIQIKPGWFPSNYVVKEGIKHQNAAVHDHQARVPVPKPQPQAADHLHVVRALYEFNSGAAEEMAFEQHELMDVIEDPSNDPEWWRCRNRHNKTGLVPKNYVEVVPGAPPVSTSHINYDPVPQPSNALNALPAAALQQQQQNGAGNVSI